MIRTSIFVLGAVLLAAQLAAEDSTQAAFGAKVFAENCNRCHEAPDPSTRDGRTWRPISMHMRLFGDFSRHDQELVLAFLRTFNTPKKP